jgi:hypothetical protein
VMALHVLSFIHFTKLLPGLGPYIICMLLMLLFLWRLLCFVGCLDVLLMFGAYKTARGFAISRIVIRFLWLAAASTFVTYLYVWVLVCVSFLSLTLSPCALCCLFIWMLNIEQESLRWEKCKKFWFNLFPDLCACSGWLCCG